MRSKAKSAFGGRKFLVLGILLTFLTAGFTFGQGVPVQDQEKQEGQPVPAPYLVLFGIQWDICGYGSGYEIKELGVTTGIIFVKDKNSILGIAAVIAITKGNISIPIAGWFKLATPEEQGFVINDVGESIFTKTKAEGEMMVPRSGKDQNGNHVIVFYLVKKSGERELLKFVEVKQFVEENFQNPEK